MLNFEPYSLETLKKYIPFIRKCPYELCDISAGFIFMWQEDSDVRFALLNNTFVVSRLTGDQVSFSWPYGDDPDAMIDELINYVRENDYPLRFFGINETQLEVMRADKRFSSVMAEYDIRWSDYLYSFNDAASFAGRKFSGQRNHINKFKKLYGEPDIRLMKKEDLPRVLTMLDKYEEEHPDANAMERLELKHTRQVLDKFDELSLYAAYLSVGDEIAAFTLGEIVGDKLIIHVEKALREYEGVYPTMYNSFVRLISESVSTQPKLVKAKLTMYSVNASSDQAALCIELLEDTAHALPDEYV